MPQVLARSGHIVSDVTIPSANPTIPPPLKRPTLDCNSCREKNSSQAEHLLDCSWSVGTKVATVQVTKYRKKKK